MPGRWKHWALLLPPALRAIVRAAAAVSILLSGLLQPAPTPALAAPAEQIGCTFQRGFRSLVVKIPQIVGQCLENERFNPENGNAEQRTTGGLLVWRKADNWTAFTDGSTTWINGPYGLQSRPNNQTFAWEPPAAPAPPPVWSAVPPPDWAVTLPPDFAPAAVGGAAGPAPARPTAPIQPAVLPPATSPPRPIQQALRPAWDALMGNPGRFTDGPPYSQWFADVVSVTQVELTPLAPSVIPGMWAAFVPAVNAIGVSTDVLREDPRAQATVLAHELTHAAQTYSGRDGKRECLKLEVEAFVVQSAVWEAFWNGYGPSRTKLEQEEHSLTRLLVERGESALYGVITDNAGYQHQCRRAAGFQVDPAWS